MVTTSVAKLVERSLALKFVTLAKHARLAGVTLADSARPREALRACKTALVLTPQYALHCELPDHGGLGNPLTNEEVTMATAKKKAPAKKAAKKKSKKK